ncbi:MAG TPA: 7TM diverse intracellular signaling domain-containing protein, partial [Hanamia sp.]
MYKSICLMALLLMCSIKNIAQNTFIDDQIDTIVSNLGPKKFIPQIVVDKLHFKKAENRRLNFGLTGCEYYYIILKLSASRTLNNQVLSIDNTSLDTITIYRLYDDADDSVLYLGGQLVSFDTKRNYVWHTVPVEITQRPSYYCIAVKSSQKNINIQYEIQDQDAFLNNYQGSERIVYFYMGIAFMISAIILLAFFLFKKHVFSAYLAYMVCISVWIVSHYDRIFPYLYPTLPVINQIIKPISSLGAGLFLLVVLQSVFRQNLVPDKGLGKLVRSLKAILLISIGLMLLLLSPQLNSTVRGILITLWHLELIFLIALIIFIPFHFLATGSIAKIFSMAMFIICVMTLVQLFANAGFIKSYFLNEHGMALGTMLENSIMAFGLFYGLLEERKNKELQMFALEEEQTATLKKLINVQDKERKRIAGDLHDNLGPLLAALKINFRRIVNAKEEKKQLELVQKTENIIDDSIIEIRNVAHNLMPKNLSSNGLINTLSDYFQDMEQLYSKKIYFNHDVQSVFESDL